MARPRRDFRSRVSARLTDWIGPADQGFVNIASTGATIISSASFEAPATVVRTRGYVGIRPQSAAADVTMIGAIGVGIVSAEALAAGVASVPTPFRDADWGGWHVWRSFAFEFQFGDASGFILWDFGFEVDSKAMRKIASNEAIVVVAESQQGAFGLFDGMRTLIKLP